MFWFEVNSSTRQLIPLAYNLKNVTWRLRKKMSVWIVFDDFLRFMIKRFLLCHLNFIDIVHADLSFWKQLSTSFNQDRFEDYFHRVSETWLLRFRVAFDMLPGSRIRFFPPVPSRVEKELRWENGPWKWTWNFNQGTSERIWNIMKVKLYGTLGGVMGHHVEHYGFI